MKLLFMIFIGMWTKLTPTHCIFVVQILGTNKHVRTVLEVTRNTKDLNAYSGKNNSTSSKYPERGCLTPRAWTNYYVPAQSHTLNPVDYTGQPSSRWKELHRKPPLGGGRTLGRVEERLPGSHPFDGFMLLASCTGAISLGLSVSTAGINALSSSTWFRKSFLVQVRVLEGSKRHIWVCRSTSWSKWSRLGYFSRTLAVWERLQAPVRGHFQLDLGAVSQWPNGLVCSHSRL